MVYGGRPFKPNNRSQRLFKPKRRSRRGLTIAVVVIIIAIGGAWLWMFRQTPRNLDAGGVPIIKADDQPMRKRPDEPGGMKIPDLDKLVYNTGKTESKVEHLLPPPEAPLPRPAPDPIPAPPVASNAAPSSADAAQTPATPAPPAPAVALGGSPNPLPQTPSAAAPMPVPPVPPTQTAAAPATVPPPASPKASRPESCASTSPAASTDAMLYTKTSGT